MFSTYGNLDRLLLPTLFSSRGERVYSIAVISSAYSVQHMLFQTFFFVDMP